MLGDYLGDRVRGRWSISTYDGVNAFNNLIGRQAHLNLVVENAKDLSNPLNLLPGWAKTSPEMVLDAADNVLHDPSLIRSGSHGGVGGGQASVRSALSTVAEEGSKVHWWNTTAKVAGAIGLAATVASRV